MKTRLLAALWVIGLAATCGAQEADLDKLAKDLTANAASATEKVRAVVGWTNEAFVWSATDYKKRNVEEIVARKKGNCNEQALVVVNLLDRVGVKTRRVREINIQPENPSRQKTAASLVAKSGPAYSVFGLRHNDHVWIEFYDEKDKEWQPADPTLNLVGLEAWVRARMGFE